MRTQHSEEAAIGQPRRKFSETKLVGSLILDLYPPKVGEMSLLRFKPPSLRHFLTAAQEDS